MPWNFKLHVLVLECYGALMIFGWHANNVIINFGVQFLMQRK
jgi:hypothetical protein